MTAPSRTHARAGTVFSEEFIMRLLIKILCLTLFLVVSASLVSAIPSHMWSKHVGGGNPDGGRDVVTDGSNNVYFTGLFGQCIDFGGGYQCAPTGTDMFLVKYATNGAYMWSKVFPAQSNAADVDALGNLYIVGAAFADVDFGGGVMPRDGVGIFLVKFDANGVHQWSKRFSHMDGSINVESLDVQGSGDFVIAGTFGGSYDLGGGPLTSDGLDMYVAKFDANGNHVWSIHHGGSASEVIPYGIALDGLNNVVVTGRYSNTANFGGSDFTTVSPDWEDIFLAKYNADGVHQWSRSFGDIFRDEGRSVGVDAAGNIYFTGSYTGTVNFGDGDLVSAGFDIFLAKFDPTGALHWSDHYGGTSSDGGKALWVDDAGNTTLTGHFRNTIDLGGGTLTSAGDRDVFVARFDAVGTHQWSLRGGGGGSDNPVAIALDGASHVLVAGSFDGTADFGGGPFTSNGWEDAFLATYGESPLPVFIGHFAATSRGLEIHVEWDISTDELLQGFTLYRRESSSTTARVVATGDPFAIRSFTDTSVGNGKTYEYELVIQTASGDVYHSTPARATVQSVSTSLGPNHPNPFNPKTTIEYTVGERMPVVIEIFDVSGRVVTRLDQGVRRAGTHRVQWDGRAADGRPMGSGVYFYRMSGAPQTGARKMILLK
jgi:hypothetical protein